MRNHKDIIQKRVRPKVSTSILPEEEKEKRRKDMLKYYYKKRGESK